MSYDRVSKTYPVWEKYLPKGPNGRNICRCGCGREVEPPRRTFYEEKCVEDYLIRRSPQHAARLVYKRDKGICVRCGLDAEAFREHVRAIYFERWHGRLWWREKPETLKHFLDDLQIREAELNKSFWEAHHKIAVIEGGGECGLDNYETVCIWCHKKETAELRRRMAEKRKEDKGKVKLL